MPFQRRFLFSLQAVVLLTFISALQVCFASTPENYRGIAEVPQDEKYILPEQQFQDVTNYNLEIELFPQEKRIRGVAELTVMVQEGCDSLILNFYDNMIIDSLLVEGKPAQYRRAEKHLFIKFSDKSFRSRKVTVYYKGTPYNLGFASFTFGAINGNSMVFTINEPYYASTWFPCNDLPSDKATAVMSIINDTGYTSVSNGRLISEEFTGKRRKFTWKSSYAIAPYLICIYSSKYAKITSEYTDERGITMPLEYYVIPKHKEKALKDFEDIPQMIKVLSDLFGPYPFIYEKYGVAEFLWQAGAMENQTITGIGTNFITGIKAVNDVLVHELAHHWWGNAVSPRTWDDIWLNEGFATYSEALYTEQTEGKEEFLELIRQWNRGYYPDKVYAPKEDLFSNSVYKKGALILHALRGEIGDSAFFKTLRNYYANYRYSFASVNDFQMVAEAVSGKDLGLFFHQWLYNENQSPALNVEWTKTPGKTNTISVTVTQLQPDVVYTLPLELSILGDEKNMHTTKHFTIDKKTTSFEVTADFKITRIIPDPGLFIPGTVSVTE